MPNTSFDTLVSHLSAEERETLLERMRAVSSAEEISALQPAEPMEESTVSLSEKIRGESLLFRLLLWLKSVFANSTPEVIYNEIKLSSISRKVERNYPGLIDSKRGLLLNAFHERLNELKAAADFIRPYIIPLDRDESRFLIFLGGIILPSVAAKMSAEANPGPAPVPSEARAELKMKLSRAMEEIFQSVTRDEKDKMYEAAKSVEWLRQFVRLPLTRLISLFSNSSEKVYTCPFSQLENEIGQLARVLSRHVVITDEVIEAVYLFSVQSLRDGESGAAGEKAASFMAGAKERLKAPQAFMASVPMRSIGNIVFADICWKPEDFAGGEDWFLKFKSGWKKIFEQKWKAWLQECKKAELLEVLETQFGLDQFPALPFRPWEELPGCSFKHECAAGFLHWYFNEQFPAHRANLKTLMEEGKFRRKENLSAFTGAFNTLAQIPQNVAEMNRKLQSAGEGENAPRRREEIAPLLRAAEADASAILRSFGEAGRMANLVLNGVLGIQRTASFDTILNFTSIQGNGNEVFMKRIMEANTSLVQALSLLGELELVDAAGADDQRLGARRT